jgi:hypothetical protein
VQRLSHSKYALERSQGFRSALDEVPQTSNTGLTVESGTGHCVKHVLESLSGVGEIWRCSSDQSGRTAFGTLRFDGQFRYEDCAYDGAQVFRARSERGHSTVGYDSAVAYRLLEHVPCQHPSFGHDDIR